MALKYQFLCRFHLNLSSVTISCFVGSEKGTTPCSSQRWLFTVLGGNYDVMAQAQSMTPALCTVSATQSFLLCVGSLPGSCIGDGCSWTFLTGWLRSMCRTSLENSPLPSDFSLPVLSRQAREMTFFHTSSQIAQQMLVSTPSKCNLINDGWRDRSGQEMCAGST